MASKVFGPRKRRTRQHVIADQGVHHVEGFIIDAGHTAQRVYSDYGYDLFVTTFDEEGFIEPGLIRIQVKAFETVHAVNGQIAYDLDIRDFHLWIAERSPVVLVLFDASQREAFCLDIQRYFNEDEHRRPVRGARTVRIWVPAGHRWNGEAVAAVRHRNRGILLLRRD